MNEIPLCCSVRLRAGHSPDIFPEKVKNISKLQELKSYWWLGGWTVSLADVVLIFLSNAKLALSSYGAIRGLSWVLLNAMISVLPGSVVHHEVNEGVNGMDNEGDDAEPQPGGGPLPGVLRHGGERSGQPYERPRTDTVDEETWYNSLLFCTSSIWVWEGEDTWDNNRGEGLPYESVESRKGDFPRVWIWHLNRKETSHHMTGSCKSQNQSSYFIHFLPLIRSICQHVGTCHPIARSHPSRQDISTSTHLLSDLAIKM